MKKLLFVGTFAILGASTVQAQDDQTVITQDEDQTVITTSSSNEDGFKATSGDKTLEFQFAPFGESPLGIDGIRGRIFGSDNKALRLNIDLQYDTQSSITQQANTDFDIPELRFNDSEFVFNVKPGIEQHFNGTQKLSPYMGVEVELGFAVKSERQELQIPADDNIYFTKTTTSNVRIGAGLVAGVDFYVTRKLYLGAELGYGLRYIKKLNSKEKSDIPDVEDQSFPQGGSFYIGPRVNGAIRLGYAF